ncbi:unnamed protein product [Calypogeia fissa]
MAVWKSSTPARSRPASADARGRERGEGRGGAVEAKDGALMTQQQQQRKKADGSWWKCMSRPSAVSPPPHRKRSSSGKEGGKSSSNKGSGGTSDTISTLSKSLAVEFRSVDNLLPTNERSTSDSLGINRQSFLYSSGDGNARSSSNSKTLLEVKTTTGENGIMKKFTTLAEGIDLRGSSSPFRPRLSPGKVSPLVEQAQQSTATAESRAADGNSNNYAIVMSQPSYTSYSKLNGSNSTIGSSPPVDRMATSPSPTLFEMMSHDQDVHTKPLLAHDAAQQQNGGLQLTTNALSGAPKQQPSMQDKVSGILLGGSSPGNQFNDESSSDLKLTLSGKDGYNVTVSVHRHILVANSRFFAAKLSDRWSKQQHSLPHLVEISDCEDVELYLETLRLMYCCDLKRTLMKETVVRVLGILKVSAAIVFEAGVVSCLEFLEAVPWAEDEEEQIRSLLSQLQLESVGADEVLKRCAAFEATNSEDILVRLLNSVTKGTDEKARREMKNLVSRMLRENVSQNKEHFDVSKESLYKACHCCVDSILHLFMQATSPEFVSKNSEDRGALFAQIARQADNLHWLVDILIDRRIADDLVRLWAHQSELATLHMQVPTMYRYEVSRLTARFCIAIGKGQVVSPKDVRYMLLQTWLQPLVEDFGWMQRCCKALDKKVVEEGISQTILTLPLKQQQTILLSWFDRFSNSGDDCPNLQKAFEVWWRRMFLRPGSLDEDMNVPLLESHIPS